MRREPSEQSTHTIERYLEKETLKPRLNSLQEAAALREKLIEIYDPQKTNLQLAAELNTTAQKVKRGLKYLRNHEVHLESKKGKGSSLKATDRKQKAVELYKKDWKKEQIADELHVARSTLDKYLKKEGIKPMKKEASLKAAIREKKAVELYKRYWKAEQIATELNVSTRTVERYLKKWGIKIEKQKKMSTPFEAALRRQQVAELTELGFITEDIATKLSVSKSTIERDYKELGIKLKGGRRPSSVYKKMNYTKRPGPGRKVLPEDAKRREKLIKIYDPKKTDAELATELNSNPRKIKDDIKYLRSHGVELTSRKKRQL
jgi:orotate phosphoribosyltransferase-like protein